ncbi:hypothetical protein Pelo_2234 [Pelomyxa schiedti]|nr:hypothetical protein Pelo_2234 [Pelomyxa schiedti]
MLGVGGPGMMSQSATPANVAVGPVTSTTTSASSCAMMTTGTPIGVVNVTLLKKKIHKVVSSPSLRDSFQSVDPSVAALIELALEERIRNVFVELVKASKHRADLEPKRTFRTIEISTPKNVLIELQEDEEKEERLRQARLQQTQSSARAQEDIRKKSEPEAKHKLEEEEELRRKMNASNQAALQAVGERQRRTLFTEREYTQLQKLFELKKKNMPLTAEQDRQYTQLHTLFVKARQQQINRLEADQRKAEEERKNEMEARVIRLVTLNDCLFCQYIIGPQVIQKFLRKRIGKAAALQQDKQS